MLTVPLRGTVGKDADLDESAKCAGDYHRALLMYESVYDAEALGENINGQFRHITQTNVDGALECIPVGIYILASLPICIKYRTLLHESLYLHLPRIIEETPKSPIYRCSHGHETPLGGMNDKWDSGTKDCNMLLVFG